MIHLIYASIATEDFGTEQLTELLNQSREANARLGLTGILLNSRRSFFQVLEGEPDAVDGLYKKLLVDKRHTNVSQIIREPIARRYFGDWSMGFTSASPEELSHIPGLNDFFGNGSCFTKLDAGRAKKLLTAFGKGRWQAELTGPKRERV
jgi:hypothetical protein